MKLRTKIITAAAALSGAGVLGVGAIANTTSKVFADGMHTYSCVDITMTETVNNPGSYKTTNAETFSILHGIAEGELSTTWTNANYTANVNGKPASAIKIGGSRTDRYEGAVALSFKSYEVSRLIVYAAAWSGDSHAPDLTIGDQHYTLPITTDNAYTFKPYTFDFDATSTITLTNGSGNTASHRIVISKIVFKVTGAVTPIDSSTSTETSSEPEDTSHSVEPSESTVVEFAQNTLKQSSKTIEQDGVTITNSSDYTGTVTELRVYKNQTLTLTVSSGKIKEIIFTCTASGTSKYGPGCFAAQTGYSYSDNIGTWVGDASSVAFNASANQVRITNIKVTYQ